MKRTVITVSVELEGPSVDGQNFRHWLLDHRSEPDHPEDQFRVVAVDVVEEDGRAG